MIQTLIKIHIENDIVPRLIPVYCLGFFTAFYLLFSLLSYVSHPCTSVSPTRCIALFIVNEWHLEPSVSKHRTANF